MKLTEKVISYLQIKNSRMHGAKMHRLTHIKSFNSEFINFKVSPIKTYVEMIDCKILPSKI